MLRTVTGVTSDDIGKYEEWVKQQPPDLTPPPVIAPPAPAEKKVLSSSEKASPPGGEKILARDATKAEVNAKDNNGKTPLHWAARRGCKDVAELLRQHGGHE